MSFCEAPMLAAKVAAGELPPVDERLPKEPQVGVANIPEDWLKPEIGNYGGTLRMVDYDQTIGHDAGWIAQGEFWLNTQGFQHDNAKVVGNLFKGYEGSKDGKNFTFYLREGLKYSDGTPMTTADVEFWYKDVMFNEKLTPAIGQDWRAGRKPDGEVMKLEVVDDYTFKISFAEPYGAFLARLTYWPGTLNSKQFMMKYHPTYTPLEQLEPLIKERGFEPGEWWRLYTYMADWNNSVETGRPMYGPWVPKERSSTNWVLERNPYYWKIDAAGNQLPYIDRLDQVVVTNAEAATVKILAGEVDLADRATIAKSAPLYQQYAAEKGYRVQQLPQHASLGEVFLNLTNTDPVWRQVVQDLRFRQALSYAIDRQQVIDAVYSGFAGLPRVIPLNEYNKEKANQLLDEVGLTEKDADGCRLGPDGKPFVIAFELSTFTGEEVPTAEIVSKFWKEAGVCTSMKNVEPNLFQTTAEANELEAFVWWAHYPRWPFHEPNDYVGQAWQYTYAPLWFKWYDNQGKQGEVDPEAQGEEGPEAYNQLRALQDEMLGTTDVAKQQGLWEQIKQNVTDNVWWIPITDDVISFSIYNANLGNVPPKGVAIEVKTAAEMFYYK